MISCIIVEDVPLAVAKLEGFIGRVSFLHLSGSFSNGLDAITFLQSNPVDLVFLDIQMEQFTGIQLLESLYSRPHIVIVSAYEEYAIQGFEYDVTDYLLKPYSFERFLKAVNKVQAAMQQSCQLTPKEYIFLKTEYRMVRVNLSEILYIEGLGAYLYVITETSKIMTLLSFRDMEALLPPEAFVRIHKSYIIPINKIESIERNVVKITHMRIPVGKSYQKEFYLRLK